jgi:UDP-N-acetylglucosamine--N-acetylmuramyl-(pentapeptide) pyrophosphoryl-undecaprenol N-acetylglucosamine transferase
MKSIKILLYAVNGLGMGHITRLLAIAKYIRRYCLVIGKEPEIIFLSTSEVDTLPFLYNFPVFKIPSKTIIKKGGMNQQRYQKMAKMMIWNCISTHDPDMLVVDTFPSGSFDELYDVMDFGFKKVFIYRPRKDRKKLWKNPIIKAYDRILYIDEAHESESKITEQTEEKIQHLGAIVQRNRSEMLAPEEACKHLGLNPKKKTACILAGGGGDKSNQAFFERMLILIQDFPKIQFVIGAGPLYKGAEIPSKQARWFYRADISLYWNAFDFVIAAGGFNSVNELIHAQIPTLFFAQNRLYDNQQARIDSLFDQGYCLQFSRESDDQEIKKAIHEIASKAQQKRIKKGLAKHNLKNEACDAALAVLELLIPEQQLQKAEDILDMGLIQKFLERGLDERIICKTIHAVILFQEKINELGEDLDYIDDDDILVTVDDFLSHSIAHSYASNAILPLIFEAIKREENTSLSLLLEDLNSTILQY